MAQNTRHPHALANTHTGTAIQNTFHFPIIACILTLAATHSPMHQHRHHITDTHTCPFFGRKQRSPKCCSQPSGGPPALIYVKKDSRAPTAQTRQRRSHVQAQTRTNTHRRCSGPQPKRPARLCQFWPSSH